MNRLLMMLMQEDEQQDDCENHIKGGRDNEHIFRMKIIVH